MRSRSLLYGSPRRLIPLSAGWSRRIGRRFLTPILSILVLLCPGLSGFASAGVNAWTTNGPEGKGIHALAIDPVTPTILYAGTSGAGVFKSRDGGASWTAINTGLNTTFVVSTIVIDPRTPTVLFAGTGLGLASGDAGGVFKSTNGGESWRAVNAGLKGAYGGTAAVFALAIDPSTPATLYVSTYGGGVFKSTNGGESWRAINTGFNRYPHIVSALAINPSAPATLYAGTSYDNEFGPGDGIFKSTNGGETWRKINAGLTDFSVFALAVDPSAPATLYAGTLSGVFKSNNGGGNWTALNKGLTSTDVSALAIDRSNPATLYAGTSDGGVFKSSDRGGTWTEMNHGLTDVTVSALAIDSTNPSTLHAGTSGSGVFDYQGLVGGCASDPTTLCLKDGRFQVQTQWSTSDGRHGLGQAIPLTRDTGAFWFFDSANIEIVVKVLDGCPMNSRYWAFAGGLTNVGVTLIVTDTQTGAVKSYESARGNPFPPIQDSDAFGICP